VTFLVRARRAAQLREHGLTIRSRFGDFHRPSPPTLLEEELAEPFDLILLSCKAYDLEGAIASFAKGVGPASAILPLLNGMRHMDALADRFGAARLLGGQCAISVRLEPDGSIVHFNDVHSLSFGELDGSRSPRIEKIAPQILNAGFEARLADDVLQDMWEKWVFIASMAGAACLMRAAIGDIVAAGASDIAAGILDECAGIAAEHGHAPRAPELKRIRAVLTVPGSPLMPSMLRDMESGMRVEGDQILGDFLRRAAKPNPRSLLRIAYMNVKAYEARRARDETRVD
jgi:2-dehydropantoate 2-reductase